MPQRKKDFVLPGKAHCKCHYECKSLTAADFLRLNTEFSALSTDAQNSYLMSRISLVPINARRNGKYESASESRRQTSALYSVPSEAGRVQVCNKTFKDIFNISSKKNQNMLNRLKAGNIVFKDGRGKNPNSRRFKYTEQQRCQIKEHVNSFPREESHYSRKKSSKEYLSPDLNIHRLYTAFKKKYPDTIVDGKYYRRVFKREFPKLGFKRPRTDTCRTCDKLKAEISSTPGSRQLAIIAKKELHLRKAENARYLLDQSLLQSQYPSSSVFTISMDMQQVIFTPTLTHSNMFYSRQLSNYNLCLHTGNSQVFMCMWHEGIAGRGGNEVLSCLLKILSSQLTPKKHLELWCDNCCGQNKNKMVLAMIAHLVVKGFYHTIDLKFLVSGHSYMPCDRDFGVIEKRKRISKCMVPEEVQNMVKESRLNNPFEVVSMEKKDFVDSAKICETYLNTTALKISTKSWIRVSKSDLPLIKTRSTFNEMEQWESASIFKKGKFPIFKGLTCFPPDEKTPVINEAKKKDLLDMLEFMDVKYHNFYKNICM